MEGYGHFNYADAPEIFLGRIGSGPMRIAWDTNILLDYLQFGFRMWDEREIPILEEGYRTDVEALGDLMNWYAVADLRFYLFGRVLVDAKKVLPEDRRLQREMAIDHFAEALDLGDEEASVSGNLHIYHRYDVAEPSVEEHEYRDQLALLPDGHDRMLVLEALDRDMHVFLTRDQEILKRSTVFKRLGLLIASPSTLCSLIHDARIPYPYLPAADLQRISEVIAALGHYNEDEE